MIVQEILCSTKRRCLEKQYFFTINYEPSSSSKSSFKRLEDVLTNIVFKPKPHSCTDNYNFKKLKIIIITLVE